MAGPVKVDFSAFIVQVPAAEYAPAAVATSARGVPMSMVVMCFMNHPDLLLMKVSSFEGGSRRVARSMVRCRRHDQGSGVRNLRSVGSASSGLEERRIVPAGFAGLARGFRGTSCAEQTVESIRTQFHGLRVFGQCLPRLR